MKRLIPLLVLALASTVVAQAAPQDGSSAQAAFEKGSFPFEGEISATRLNVRLAPDTGPKGIITAMLQSGDKVTVVAETDGFYQILPPSGSAVWVWGKSIRRQGDTGTVLRDGVPVRIDSRVNAQTLGTLNTGDTVEILRDHMGWFKIRAPHSVPCFVGSKYVRMMRRLDAELIAKDVPNFVAPQKVEAKPEADTDALERIRMAEALLDQQNAFIAAGQADKLNYTEIVHLYSEAANLAKSDAIRRQAETAHKKYKLVQETLDILGVEISKVRDWIEQQKEIEKRRLETTSKTYAFTGYVDTVGMLWKRPGPFKLEMGGKTICFVKPRDGDAEMIDNLKWRYKEYVGINGTVVKDPEGWEGSTLVIVDEITPLNIAAK